MRNPISIEKLVFLKIVWQAPYSINRFRGEDGKAGKNKKEGSPELHP
jgi:hypothetical protein